MKHCTRYFTLASSIAAALVTVDSAHAHPGDHTGSAFGTFLHMLESPFHSIVWLCAIGFAFAAMFIGVVKVKKWIAK